MNKFNNMKHKVLYIYDYNSSLNSNTFRWLKEHLPNTDMYSINYNQSNPNDGIESLCNHAMVEHNFDSLSAEEIEKFKHLAIKYESQDKELYHI